MPRSLLAIGALSVAMLLGVLGVKAESTDPGRGEALLVCAFVVSGVVALVLLAAHLRTPAAGRGARQETGLDLARVGRVEKELASRGPAVEGSAAHEISRELGDAPAAGVSVLQPVGLLAAVEGILDDASLGSSAAAEVRLEKAEPATHAYAVGGPGFTAPRLAPSGRGEAGTGSGEKALLAPSALLDALQDLHQHELLAAADSVAEAPTEARDQGSVGLRE